MFRLPAYRPLAKQSRPTPTTSSRHRQTRRLALAVSLIAATLLPAQSAIAGQGTIEPDSPVSWGYDAGHVKFWCWQNATTPTLPGNDTGCTAGDNWGWS